MVTQSSLASTLSRSVYRAISFRKPDRVASSGLLLQEAQDVGFQLLDVLDPAPALHVVLLLQGLYVAGLVTDGVVELRQGQLRARLPQAVDQVRELQQLGGGGLQLREQVRVADDLVQRRPLALRQGGHLVQRGGADAPGRVVDDPPQPQVIHGVVQHAQIGQHILDLRPVEELHAPHHLVGDAVALHGVFQLRWTGRSSGTAPRCPGSAGHDSPPSGCPRPRSWPRRSR